MNEKHLNGLTATRGFAALMIVIFHFGLNVFPFKHMQPFFAKGNVAVSYFFTLSGFIMCYTYFNQQVAYKDYLKRRIARIAPLYWVAMIISIIRVRDEAQLGFKTLLNFFFAQAYVPGYALTINSAGWSLSVEMLFYLLFPLLLLLYKANQQRFAYGALFFYVLSQLVHLWMVAHAKPNNNNWHELTYYFPFAHLNEFVIGMAGYYFYTHNKEQLSKMPVLVTLAMVVLSIVYLQFSKHNGLLSPLFVLMIVGIACKTDSWLSAKPLVWLGEVSYGIYILQMPVNFYVSKLNAKYLGLTANWFFLFFVIVLVVVSALCYSYVEKPLRRKINSLKI